MNRGDNRGGRPYTARPASDGGHAPAQGPSPQDSRRRLEAMFPGAPPARRGPPRGEGRGFPSPRRQRLERLRMAREPHEIQEAADGFLRHHQLPDDVEILIKLLQHPEQKVLRDALGQLSSLMFQGRLRNVVLLVGRLEELAGRANLEEATRSLMAGVRAQADQITAADGIQPF